MLHFAPPKFSQIWCTSPPRWICEGAIYATECCTISKTLTQEVVLTKTKPIFSLYQQTIASTQNCEKNKQKTQSLLKTIFKWKPTFYQYTLFYVLSRQDLPLGLLHDIHHFSERFGERLDEVDDLITANRLFYQRTRDIGVVSAHDAINLGFR